MEEGWGGEPKWLRQRHVCGNRITRAFFGHELQNSLLFTYGERSRSIMQEPGHGAYIPVALKSCCLSKLSSLSASSTRMASLLLYVYKYISPQSHVRNINTPIWEYIGHFPAIFSHELTHSPLIEVEVKVQNNRDIDLRSYRPALLSTQSCCMSDSCNYLTVWQCNSPTLPTLFVKAIVSLSQRLIVSYPHTRVGTLVAMATTTGDCLTYRVPHIYRRWPVGDVWTNWWILSKDPKDKNKSFTKANLEANMGKDGFIRLQLVKGSSFFSPFNT